MRLFKLSDIPLNELLELDNDSLRDLSPISTTIDNDRFDSLMLYF